MATYLITSPDGQKFKVTGDGTQEEALAHIQQTYQAPETPAQATQAAPQPSSEGGVGRNVALAGRAVGEGVFSGATAAPDMMLNSPDAAQITGLPVFSQLATLSKATGVTPARMISKLLNHVTGANIPEADSFHDLFSNLLTQAGAPEPQTGNEQLGSAAVRGASSALSLGGAGSVANNVRAALAGASGGTSAEVARQSGAGPAGQTVAGLVGGLVPGAAENTVTGAGRFLKNAFQPLTRSGQESMAGNILGDAARNPQAAAENLRNTQEIIPGSARTSGEASKDLGLLALEKGVRGRNAATFAERGSEQNAARQAALTDVAGTEADLKAATEARQSAANTQYGKAYAGDTQIDLGALEKRPAIADALGKADEMIANGGKDVGTVERLHFAKLALDDRIDTAVRAGEGNQARSLINARDALVSKIEAAAPAYKEARLSFKAASAPINQMEVMQDIGKRANTTAVSVDTGLPILSPAGFSRALDKALEQNSDLTPEQVSKLEKIRSDLQAGQAINSNLKTPGSDTFQNLSIAQAFGIGPKGAHPIVKVLTSPLQWIYKAAGSDARVNEILTEAMLDPKLSAQLLERATPANIRSISAAMKRRLAASGLGSVIAAGSRAAGTSEAQSSSGT